MSTIFTKKGYASTYGGVTREGLSQLFNISKLCFSEKVNKKTSKETLQ